MNEITGKKIFVLYPDARLRNIFYGTLRNTFEVYYIYDYEKIRPLIEYYPGSIILLNLIDNDLNWLPEEICSEFEGFREEIKPSVIALYDDWKDSGEFCTRSMKYTGDDAVLKDEIRCLLTDLDGKGRRNFVRYGGREEKVASIKFKALSGEVSGIVHDISASGLSFSLANPSEIQVGETLEITLKLGNSEVELTAVKILERNLGGNIFHIVKFDNTISKNANAELLGFIYESLDAEMNEFIKNLSN